MAKKNIQHLSKAFLGRSLETGTEVIFEDVPDLSIIEPANYRSIDQAFVESLKESIEQVGVHTAVKLAAVRPDKTDPYSIICVDGHHRIEAVRQMRDEAVAERKEWLYRKLPVHLVVENERSVTPTQAAIINGVRRKDTVVERAMAVKAFKSQGLTNVRISQQMGIDRRSVERALMVSDLPDSVLKVASEFGSKLNDTKLYAAARRYILVNSKKKSLDEVFPEFQGSLEERTILALTRDSPRAKPAATEPQNYKALAIAALREYLPAMKYSAKDIEKIISVLP